MSKHTIILVQFTPNRNTRTFLDFETVTQAMEGVINLFEERLKQQHPHVRNITYDVADLNLYIDNLTDLSALVFNPQTSAYDPFNKAWIKGRILQFLKRQAGQ